MPKEPTQEHFLSDLLGLLRRQRLLIAACTLLALGVGVAYVLVKTPIYEASAEVSFNDLSEDLRALGTPTSLPFDPATGAAADAEVITSPNVVNRVAAAVGGDLSRAEVRDSVQTAVDPQTNLVTIQASAESGALAARIANSFAGETRDVVTRRERERLGDAADRLAAQSGGGEDGVTQITRERISALQSLASFARPVTIATQADVPEQAASPRPAREVTLALILGLIVGVLAAFLRDSLDRRLIDPNDVQHHLEIPLLGYIGADCLGKVAINTNGAGSGPDETIERFRILRSNLDFLSPDGGIRTVAVTSPLPEEGKSTVSAGIASASALAGKRTLLVECDLRRPVLGERFSKLSEPGLSDWIAGRASPEEVLQQVVVDETSAPAEGEIPVQAPAAPLDFVAAGTTAPRPTEFLGSDRFKEFLAEVRRGYDLVLLDCAPLLPVGDTLEVIPEVDAVLLCIRLDRTTQEQALAARAAVEHFPPRPTAVVVTGARRGQPDYHYYYGYYGPKQTVSQ